MLLGLALSARPSKSAAQLLDEYVFEPLDLESTTRRGPRPPRRRRPTPCSTGHHSLPGPDGVMNCTEPLDITTHSSSVGFTDSGVTSTIADLGRYAQALAAGALAREGQPDRWANLLPVSADGPSWLQATGGAYLAGLARRSARLDAGLPHERLLRPRHRHDGRRGAEQQRRRQRARGDPSRGNSPPSPRRRRRPPVRPHPEFGLPWTAEQYHEAITQAAVCPLPAP